MLVCFCPMATPWTEFRMRFYLSGRKPSLIWILSLSCHCSDLFYYRVWYGDHWHPNVKNSKLYNEQTIERLEKWGWRVFAKVHKGMKLPQHDKYLLCLNILKRTIPGYRNSSSMVRIANSLLFDEQHQGNCKGREVC